MAQHAVVGHVNIKGGRGDEATKMLNEQVVPRLKGQAGRVAAWWTRSLDGTKGVSVVVFESKEAADAALANMMQGRNPDDPVEMASAEVYEVLASL